MGLFIFWRRPWGGHCLPRPLACLNRDRPGCVHRQGNLAGLLAALGNLPGIHCLCRRQQAGQILSLRIGAVGKVQAATGVGAAGGQQLGKARRTAQRIRLVFW